MSLRQITIAPVFPLWLILLLFFVGLAAVIIQYWLVRRRLGPSKALAISFLRLGAIFLLISFALNPSLVSKKEHKISPSIAILLDTSQSMGLTGAGGNGSRLDEAKAILLSGSKPLLKSLAGRFNVRFYGLGESLRSIEAEELSGLKAEGRGGDVAEAVEKLIGKNALAVLLSDGNLKWEENHSTDLPLLVVPVGDTKGYKDLLIKVVKAPAMAFRGREVVIDVTIRGYGYKGLTLPVHLKEGNRLLKAKTVSFHDDPAEMTIPLSFIPGEVGEHNLSIGIPPQVGESLTSNNTVNLPLKVVRDKVRILMISGSPSLNYRFMRMAFKNDPSIDLLSFVVLRTPTDIINVPLQEQSLIPLPVETLFSKELKDFDLLIFDNLPSHLYLKPSYLESVKDFVRGGGGFAMIGGPNFSDEGRYTGTPIEDILPVRLIEKEDYHRDNSSGVKLSQAGKVHPITRFSSDEGYDIKLWQEMPSLDGINLLVPKNSGTVLLESTDGASHPVLTVGSYGRGRVLALATDYSWKWYMGMVAKSKENWVYLRFMEKLVRWLTNDPSLDSVQIILPEKTGSIGEEMEIRIKAREEDFSPNRKGVVSLSVFNPDGMKIGSRIKSTGQSGEYLGSFLPEKGGIYKLRIETPNSRLEEYLVIANPLEELDAVPQPERLRMISASTGGKFLSKDDDLLKEIEAYAEKSESRFTEVRNSPLWGRLYALILILFLITTEWYLRRRWGLV